MHLNVYSSIFYKTQDKVRKISIHKQINVYKKEGMYICVYIYIYIYIHTHTYMGIWVYYIYTQWNITHKNKILPFATI